MVKKILHTSLLIFTVNLFAQQAYYNDVNLSLSGINLRDELATKIINTHTNVLSYGWEANQATDVNPNDATKVFLIYGWENGSDGNCTNDLERDISNNGGSSCQWNREHVYPKSLGTPSFSSNTTPGADAHHIRASDVQRNNQRGNRLFTDGSGSSQIVNQNWYPGDEWKGDVARIIMYMYLRYGNQCLPINVGSGTVNSVDSNMLNLFLEWNAEDPVSAQEDQRNTYLSDTNNQFGQGNRNPFIDNPNLATQIWGGPVAQDRWSTANVDKFNKFEVKIYPNPVTENTIHIDATENIKLVKIFNVLGKQVLTSEEKVIDASILNNGIYLVKIYSDVGTTTKKLIKQ